MDLRTEVQRGPDFHTLRAFVGRTKPLSLIINDKLLAA